MDITTYALCKKLIAGATSGIRGLRVEGTTLYITTTDDQELEMIFPTPEDGVSIETVQIDESNHLICGLSNNETIDAGEVKTVQGEKGDAFTYEDFTEEQLESLRGYTPQKGTDYFTQSDIDEIISIINADDGVLADYLKITDAEQEYLKLSDGYTRQEIDEKLANVTVDLSDYYTKNQADEIFLKEHQSLDGLATEEWVEEKIAEAQVPEVDLSKYLKVEDAEDIYVKKEDIPDLENYYDKDEIDEMLSRIDPSGTGDEPATEEDIDKMFQDRYSSLFAEKEDIDALFTERYSGLYATEHDIDQMFGKN